MSGRRSRIKGARTERSIVNALQAQRYCGRARAALRVGRRSLRRGYRAAAYGPRSVR